MDLGSVGNEGTETKMLTANWAWGLGFREVGHEGMEKNKGSVTFMRLRGYGGYYRHPSLHSVFNTSMQRKDRGHRGGDVFVTWMDGAEGFEASDNRRLL